MESPQETVTEIKGEVYKMLKYSKRNGPAYSKFKKPVQVRN